MFRELFSKRKQESGPSNKELFDGAIFMANEVAKNNPEDIYYLIRSFGKKIQYDYFASFFGHAGIERYFQSSTHDLERLTEKSLFINPSDDEFNSSQKDWFFDEIESKGKVEDHSVVADLSKDVVLPWPWQSGRMLNCLEHIGKERGSGPWQYDETNHMLDYWEEMRVFFVHGGNHSIASGILKGEGKLPSSQTISMKNMYDNIFTDGEIYYRKKKSGKVMIAPVRNLSFAIMFEMARVGGKH